MKIKNVAKEVQTRINALTEQKTGEIVKIKDKLAQLRADLEAIQGRAKAATEALDADAYMKEQTAAQKTAAEISMYESRLEQINSREMVTEEDSERTINSLLAYARELDDLARKEMEPHIEALRAIEREYTELFDETTEVMRGWAHSIRPRRYPADSRGERQAIPVYTYTPAESDHVAILRGYLDRLENMIEGRE